MYLDLSLSYTDILDSIVNAVTSAVLAQNIEATAPNGGDTPVDTPLEAHEPVASDELHREPLLRPDDDAKRDTANTDAIGEDRARASAVGTTVEGHVGPSSGPIVIDLTMSDDEDEESAPSKAHSLSRSAPATSAEVRLHAAELTTLFNMLNPEARVLAHQFSLNPSSENAKKLLLSFSLKDAEIWKVLMDRTVAGEHIPNDMRVTGSPAVAPSTQSRQLPVQRQPAQHQITSPSISMSQGQNVLSSHSRNGGLVNHNTLEYPFTFRHTIPTQQTAPMAPTPGSSTSSFGGHGRRSQT